MTKDEIVQMAIEAGFCTQDLPSIRAANVYGEVNDELEAFAALVYAKAIAEENEACAKVCDDIDVEYGGEDVQATWCSNIIRARQIFHKKHSK